MSWGSCKKIFFKQHKRKYKILWKFIDRYMKYIVFQEIDNYDCFCCQDIADSDSKMYRKPPQKLLYL